jgi:hypothetical protein
MILSSLSWGAMMDDERACKRLSVNVRKCGNVTSPTTEADEPFIDEVMSEIDKLVNDDAHFINWSVVIDA